jgi:SAM-dependent methyltransferase
VFESLARRLATYRSRVVRTISPKDDMYRGDDNQYFFVGASAIVAIMHAMSLLGKTSFGSVLDLPCGHGRVLRMLAAAFPEAALTACDIDRNGVKFCAETFGATPVFSRPHPQEIPLFGEFDLIWCGSLLTHLDKHLWDAFLEFFTDRLADGGLLVLTTHGREIPRRGPPDDVRWRSIVTDFEGEGFGYRDHRHARGYGTSIAKPSWVLERFYDRRKLMIVGYSERGWADHQDVVAAVKTDIHHRQGENVLI